MTPKIQKSLDLALKLAPKTLAEGLADQGVKYERAWQHAEAALTAAGFESPALPLASKLTKDQRELVEIFAAHPGFSKYLPFLPHHAYWRRRWLGLEKPGALERETKGVPLWKRLTDAEDKEDDALLTLKLPLEERLETWWDIACGAYNLDFHYSDVKWGTWDEIKGKQPKVVALATRCLDQIAAAEADGGYLREGNDANRTWPWPFFKALQAAKVPIKPTWDPFFPTPPHPREKNPEANEQRAIYMNLIESLPAERRGKAIIASLGPFDNFRVNAGIGLLEQFPSQELADFIIAQLPRIDFPVGPIKARLKTLGFGGAASSKPKLELVVAKALKPKTVADLSPIQKKQLEAARKAYDGKKTPAARYFGALEIREVADKKTKKPAFDVFLYMVDSGSIFAAGSAKEVAGVSQSSLECEDADLREALLEVMGDAKPKKKRAARS